MCNRVFFLQLCRRLVALCFAIALAACAGLPEPGADVPHTSSFASDASEAYQLRTGDKLKLLVFGQESISGDYKVTKDGFIDVSQIGKVQAAGLTVSQLQQQLAEKLRDGIVENPQISVLLDADQPVFVTGAVRTPGEVPFRPGLDASAAVALAGGYHNRADTGVLFITRAGATIEKRFGIGDRPVINPGDVIRIPDRS